MDGHLNGDVPSACGIRPRCTDVLKLDVPTRLAACRSSAAGSRSARAAPGPPACGTPGAAARPRSGSASPQDGAPGRARSLDVRRLRRCGGDAPVDCPRCRGTFRKRHGVWSGAETMQRTRRRGRRRAALHAQQRDAQRRPRRRGRRPRHPGHEGGNQLVHDDAQRECEREPARIRAPEEGIEPPVRGWLDVVPVRQRVSAFRPDRFRTFARTIA